MEDASASQVPESDEALHSIQPITNPNPDSRPKGESEQPARKRALPVLFIALASVLLASWLIFNQKLTDRQAWRDAVDSWRRLILDTNGNATPADTAGGEPLVNDLRDTESVAGSDSENMHEVVTDDIAKAIPEPVVETITATVPDPATEAIVEDIPESMFETDPESTAEAVTEPTLESIAETGTDNKIEVTHIGSLEVIPLTQPEPVDRPVPGSTIDAAFSPESELQAGSAPKVAAEADFAPADQSVSLEMAHSLQAPGAPDTVGQSDQPGNAPQHPASEILFGFDSISLSADAKNTLDDIANAFRAADFATIQITGYADERGNPDYNLKLSRRRADAAAKYLVASGIDAGFLEVQGLGVYGESGNARPDLTPADDSQGRLVRLKLVATATSE